MTLKYYLRVHITKHNPIDVHISFGDVTDKWSVMGRRIDPSRGGPIELFLVCSTTGVTKVVVCVIMSVGWCI